jgi:hypothetical protein
MTKSLDQKAEEYIKEIRKNPNTDFNTVDEFCEGAEVGFVDGYLARDKELQADLDKCKAALAFYADNDNWGTCKCDQDSGTNSYLRAPDKEHYSDVWVGNRARETLREVGE